MKMMPALLLLLAASGFANAQSPDTSYLFPGRTMVIGYFNGHRKKCFEVRINPDLQLAYDCFDKTTAKQKNISKEVARISQLQTLLTARLIQNLNQCFWKRKQLDPSHSYHLSVREGTQTLLDMAGHSVAK